MVWSLLDDNIKFMWLKVEPNVLSFLLRQKSNRDKIAYGVDALFSYSFLVDVNAVPKLAWEMKFINQLF